MRAVLQDVDVGVEGRTPMFANHIEPGDARDGTFRGGWALGLVRDLDRWRAAFA